MANGDRLPLVQTVTSRSPHPPTTHLHHPNGGINGLGIRGDYRVLAHLNLIEVSTPPKPLGLGVVVRQDIRAKRSVRRYEDPVTKAATISVYE